MGAKLTIELSVKNLADKALKDINIQMNGVAVNAKKAFYGVNEESQKSVNSMAATTLRGFRTMSNSAEQFGRSLASGDILGSIQAFAGVAAGAFRSVGIQLAIATGGLSIIAAAIAIYLTSARKANKEMEEIEKKRAALQIKWNELRISLIVDEAEAARQTADKKHTDLIDSIDKDSKTELELLDKRLELKLIKESQYWREADKITKRARELQAANKIKWDAELQKIDDAEEEKKNKEKKTGKKNSSPTHLLMSFHKEMIALDKRYAAEKERARKEEERATEDHNKYLADMMNKSIEDAHRKQQLEENIRDRNLASAQLMFSGLANLAAVAAQQNKAFGVAYQAFAIAEATVNTYRAGLQVMADPLLIGPWKIPAMIGVIASGLAQVAQISTAKFAAGTASAPGGMALMGENGPELAYLPRGARVYNSHETRNIATGNNYTIYMPAGSSVETNRDMARRLEKMQRNGYMDKFMIKTVQYAGH